MKVQNIRLAAAAAMVGMMGVSVSLAQPGDPKKATPAAPAQPATPATPATPAKPATPAVEKVSWVEFKTSAGNIVIELDGDKAPISVANFLNYVAKGHYDGLIFHRTIPDFMIQGGGEDASHKPRATEPPITNEWKNGLHNKRGTISMARTGDPNSATSQFFINVADNDGSKKYDLDASKGGVGYAVFGHVISGMDVVDKIKDAPAEKGAGMDSVPSKPVNPVVIEKARKLTAEEAKAFTKAEAPKAEVPKAPAPAPKADAPKGK